jgi:hypothetical protein
MVWLRARRLGGAQIAAAATAIYALLSVSQGVLGVFAHATHIVILFALAGFLLLMRHLDDRRMWPLALSGVCFGLATTMKQHAVALGLFAAFYLLVTAFRRGDSVRLLVGECSIFLCGAAAPLAAILAWMIEAGNFERFWFWTVSYPTHYISEIPVFTGFLVLIYQAVKVAYYQPLNWLTALFGYILLRQTANRVAAIFIHGFLISAFIAMCPGFYFRPHYFVLILVPVALLGSYFIVGSQSLYPDRISASLRSFLPLALLMALGCASLYSERYYFFISSPNEVSRSSYDGKNPFPESIVIGDYIRRHSASNDEIAILGSEPQIYFYANRTSATGHIYMYNLTESGSIGEGLRNELFNDIQSQQPLYIVKVNNVDSWFGEADSRQKLELWSNTFLNKYYKRVGLIDIYQDTSKYYWEADAVDKKPYSDSFITVWRRDKMPPRVQDSLRAVRGLVCSPKSKPSLSSESGDFHALEWRHGHGTEGQVDRGDHWDLREAEVRIARGETVGEICRSFVISEQTYYKWRREYGGLKIDQAKRLKDLERENDA